MTADKEKALLRAGMALKEALDARDRFLYFRRRAVEEHENHDWQEEFGMLPAQYLDCYRSYRAEFLRLRKLAGRAAGPRLNPCSKCGTAPLMFQSVTEYMDDAFRAVERTDYGVRCPRCGNSAISIEWGEDAAAREWNEHNPKGGEA